jgi:hypothetical protein
MVTVTDIAAWASLILFASTLIVDDELILLAWSLVTEAVELTEDELSRTAKLFFTTVTSTVGENKLPQSACAVCSLPMTTVTVGVTLTAAAASAVYT